MMAPSSQGGRGRGRGTSRTRKVSERMAVVDEADRKNAINARLDALENDNVEDKNVFADDSDEEYIMSDDDDDVPTSDASKRKKKRKKGKGPPLGRRTTRGARERHSAQSFAALLEESELDRLPPDEPSYLTTAAGPPRTHAPRKFCSVCSNFSPYKCVRCGSTFCSVKCYHVHVETRCLKFIT